MNRNLKVRSMKLVLEAVMLVVVLIYIVPVWMVLINSLKTTDEANKFGIGIPSKLHFENYITIFQGSNVFKAFLNGVFVTSAVGLIAIIVSSMAAFFISRSGTRFAKFSYNYFICGLIIPVAVIPTYFALLVMKLNNTYIGLILVFVAYTLPLSIFLYAGFIKTIPKDIDEAAVIDGCSTLYMFYKVVFPLLAPVTTTVVVFNFVGVWNDVTTFLYFAGGDKWALPMTVYLFFGKYNQYWNLVFADIVFTIIPCLLVYLFGQKYIISGMSAGAVKG